MRNLFVFISTLLVSIEFLSSEVINLPPAKWYDPFDYNETDRNMVMPIPIGVNFTSNNTCVTYPELIANQVNDKNSQISNWNKVYPENFCYSLLTYNISREDFFNVVEKNLRM